LYGVLVVIRTAVLAAHYFGFIEAACRTANTFQLGCVSGLDRERGTTRRMR
jgi:hypothetical protein